MSYNKAVQLLAAVGLGVVGYAAGPDLATPLYGARANLDRANGTCGTAAAAFPCTVTTVYPPWSSNGGWLGASSKLTRSVMKRKSA